MVSSWPKMGYTNAGAKSLVRTLSSDSRLRSSSSERTVCGRQQGSRDGSSCTYNLSLSASSPELPQSSVAMSALEMIGMRRTDATTSRFSLVRPRTSMAGYTTGTLVALYEPEAAHVQPPASFTTQFGLAPHVRRLNVFALISSAFVSPRDRSVGRLGSCDCPQLSIAWLVFLNASQVFVLSDLLDVPPERIGSTTGTFILADETVSLLMVFVWGGVADVGGVRWVNVMGHLIVGLAFFCYVNVGTVYPGLLLARMLFAVSTGAGVGGSD